jgi:hypothetical protein
MKYVSFRRLIATLVLLPLGLGLGLAACGPESPSRPTNTAATGATVAALPSTTSVGLSSFVGSWERFASTLRENPSINDARMEINAEGVMVIRNVAGEEKHRATFVRMDGPAAVFREVAGGGRVETIWHITRSSTPGGRARIDANVQQFKPSEGMNTWSSPFLMSRT